jgi:hypothetical protein
MIERNGLSVCQLIRALEVLTLSTENASTCGNKHCAHTAADPEPLELFVLPDVVESVEPEVSPEEGLLAPEATMVILPVTPGSSWS